MDEVTETGLTFRTNPIEQIQRIKESITRKIPTKKFTAILEYTYPHTHNLSESLNQKATEHKVLTEMTDRDVDSLHSASLKLTADGLNHYAKKLEKGKGNLDKKDVSIILKALQLTPERIKSELKHRLDSIEQQQKDALAEQEKYTKEYLYYLEQADHTKNRSYLEIANKSLDMAARQATNNSLLTIESRSIKSLLVDTIPAFFTQPSSHPQ